MSVSPEPATATTPGPQAVQPATREVSVQTDPLPPPPQQEDASVQAAPDTYAAAVQAAPVTASLDVQTETESSPLLSRRSQGCQALAASYEQAEWDYAAVKQAIFCREAERLQVEEARRQTKLRRGRNYQKK